MIAGSHQVIVSMPLTLHLPIAGQLLTLANVVVQLGDWLQNVICVASAAGDRVPGRLRPVF